MSLDLMKRLSDIVASQSDIVDAKWLLHGDFYVYPRSIHQIGNLLVLMGKKDGDKNLYLVQKGKKDDLYNTFHGENLNVSPLQDGIYIKQCTLDHFNANLIRENMEFTRPGIVGMEKSFGFGDRLGLANPGHIRAVRDFSVVPVLAQQSIRELDRTHRTPEDVLDAATWAVLQEGFKKGFGADGDHLKTEKDIDRVVPAGYRMLTFDPGDFVVNKADQLRMDELKVEARSLPFDVLDTDLKTLVENYAGKTFNLGENVTLIPHEIDVLRAFVKYGYVLAHTKHLYRYTIEKYPGISFEYELSVDETDTVTTSFEHLFIVLELRRLGVHITGLAPRFKGDFEKGIDYKGDLKAFKKDFFIHARISETFGPYKLSFHSGSDKFSIYRVVSGFKNLPLHIKTAGTSYLEAMRLVARNDCELFREMAKFAISIYDDERKSYHVSADLETVPDIDRVPSERLKDLLDHNGIRQILHVAYGRILTEMGNNGQYRFRNRFLDCLKSHEEFYYSLLKQHFRRHLSPFEQ